jgi:hypothetical protein
MKYILIMFIAFNLFASCEMALAAPSPSNVIVINTTADPVPVNVQPKTTQVIYSNVTAANNFDETDLDVSTCSQIRITVASAKSSSGSVSLWGQSNSNYLARVFYLDLSQNPYGTEVLDTPGDILTLDVNGGDGGLFVRVFCR